MAMQPDRGHVTHHHRRSLTPATPPPTMHTEGPFDVLVAKDLADLETAFLADLSSPPLPIFVVKRAPDIK